MEPRDWLLLYIALKTDKDTPPPTSDPVRIMKGMFLFQEENPLPQGQNYMFVPYSYGPCAFDIYTDLAALSDEALIAREFRPGVTWPIYRITKGGTHKAREVLTRAPKDFAISLRDKKKLVHGMGFLELLKYVYSRYPAQAVNSVLQPR